MQGIILLPLDERNVHRRGVDLFCNHRAVFDVYYPVCHLRYCRVMGDYYNRLVVVAADVVQKF